MASDTGARPTPTATHLARAAIAAGVALRLSGLGWVPSPYFDELHYVPAARIFAGLAPHPGMGAWASDPLLGSSPDVNPWHPPLGKWIIALGMRMLGDGPWGFRLPCALAGSVGLLFLYGIARRLCASPAGAATAAALFAFECLDVVQSRMATLDALMASAGLGALYTLLRCREVNGARRLRWLVGSAALLAVALSVKHAAFVIGLAWALWLWQMPGLSLRERLAAMGLVAGLAPLVFMASSVTYFTHGYDLPRWWATVTFVNGRGVRELAAHPYASRPAAWLWNGKAVWCYLAQEGRTVAGVVEQGNAVPWLAALPASHAVFGKWCVARRPEDRMLVAWLPAVYLPFFLLCWSRDGFFYYMLPAAPALCVLLARALEDGPRGPWRSAAAVGLAAGYFALVAPLVFGHPVALGYHALLLRVAPR